MPNCPHSLRQELAGLLREAIVGGLSAERFALSLNASMLLQRNTSRLSDEVLDALAIILTRKQKVTLQKCFNTIRLYALEKKSAEKITEYELRLGSSSRRLTCSLLLVIHIFIALIRLIGI